MSVEVIRFSEKMQKRGWEISIFRFQANFPRGIRCIPLLFDKHKQKKRYGITRFRW